LGTDVGFWENDAEPLKTVSQPTRFQLLMV